MNYKCDNVYHFLDEWNVNFSDLKSRCEYFFNEFVISYIQNIIIVINKKITN